MTAKNIKLFTAMQDYGQMIDKITFSVEGDVPQMEPSDFVLTNCFYDLSAKKSISGVLHYHFFYHSCHNLSSLYSTIIFCDNL